MTLTITKAPRPILDATARYRAAQVLKLTRKSHPIERHRRRHVDAPRHWKRMACLDLVQWVFFYRQNGSPQAARDLDFIITEWSAPAK
ncbi:hypothetical protein TVVG_00043 [Tetraselmis viridis virus SI1]|uniref:hypothetical protein n=1 Tax=Tetraselmis viridis virus S20 TaxID=754070 RepID=UPI0002C14492|nr:hypothetical protein TVGG_00009 [Tetraselmis viridis virus S20]AGH31337.1 hypothetical protein TVGG_00009 [Tetraselmis viridis virus S20]AGH31425.1 hypothetical protein TVVG_00043 [Tetraselmis viridis virus SI1]